MSSRPAPLTLIIPTHERQQYLSRVLNFYSDTMPFEITGLVVDSSAKTYAGKIPPGFAYHHAPGVPLMEKIRRIIPLVSSPYIVFCADDDFILPRAALSCVAFLDENPDFASAQGHYVMAKLNAGSVDLDAGYTANFQVRVDSDDPAERLLQLFSPYVQNFYAVHRRSTWEAFFTLSTERIPHYCVLELLHAMLAAIHGKHAVLPLFYSVRDRSLEEDRKNPLRRVGIRDITTISTYAEEYGAFLSGLAGQLQRAAGLDDASARRAVQNAVDLYIKSYTSPPRTKTLRRRIEKILGKIVDLFGRGAARKRAEEALRHNDLRRLLENFDASSKTELADITRRIGAPQRENPLT